MSRRSAWFVAGGLVVALVLAFGASRWASTSPDGLEKVAADQAIDAGERPHALADGPLAGYATKGVDDLATATGIAGVVGVAVTFAAAGGLVWLATAAGRRRRDREDAPS